jgi:hypothetical protein
LNPRAAINDLLPFQGSPFSRLGTSPQAPKSTGYVRPVECIERRGWDSNPRALADKRFSRPPRYDHFDTSPYVFCQTKHWDILYLIFPAAYRKECFQALLLRNSLFVQMFVFLSSAKVIIAKKALSVNTFFPIFLIIF